MKKKELLVLLFALVCLLTVGCGKNDKKEEEIPSPQTLTCVNEDDGNKITTTIVQDMKENKFTKVTLSTKIKKSAYKGIAKTDKKLVKKLCVDEDEEYVSCTAKIDGKYVLTDIEFKTDKYEKDIVEDKDNGLEKIDANTLTKLKEVVEKDGSKCTITK